MARVGLDLKAITDTVTLRLFERSKFWLSRFGRLNFCYLQTFGEFSIKVRQKNPSNSVKPKHVRPTL